MTSLTCALNASERLQMKYANADPMRDHCVCMLYYNKLSILLFLLYLSVKSPQDNVQIFNVSFGVLEAKLQLQVGLYYYRTLFEKDTKDGLFRRVAKRKFSFSNKNMVWLRFAQLQSTIDQTKKQTQLTNTSYELLRWRSDDLGLFCDHKTLVPCSH